MIIIKNTHRSVVHRVTLRPSFRQCPGSRLSFLHKMKSSNLMRLKSSYNCIRKNEPLYSLQYAPIKNAALFKGALVAPTSSTWGISDGIGVGSTYSRREYDPCCAVLIVEKIWAVSCRSLSGLRTWEVISIKRSWKASFCSFTFPSRSRA